MRTAASAVLQAELAAFSEADFFLERCSQSLEASHHCAGDGRGLVITGVVLRNQPTLFGLQHCGNTPRTRR